MKQSTAVSRELRILNKIYWKNGFNNYKPIKKKYFVN